MAYDPDVIAQFRRMIDDVSEPQSYDNPTITAYLDDVGGDLRSAAAAIWREKAAKYASMVDVQEGTSRRALGDMMEHALAMATDLEGTPPDNSGSSPTTRAIERV